MAGERSAAVREGGERGSGRPQVSACTASYNMAGTESFAAVLTALRGCYAEVAPLETFIRQLQDSSSGEAEVLRGDDIGCYRTFVGACLVCVPRGARAIPRPFTFQQVRGRPRVPVACVGPGVAVSAQPPPRSEPCWGPGEAPVQWLEGAPEPLPALGGAAEGRRCLR